MLQSYVAVIERNQEGRFFAHLPDLPGATAAGASVGEALRNLSEIAADHLVDLANEGEPIPEPTEFDQVPHDPEVEEFARAYVLIDGPGRSVKISLSIDEGLLARIDRAATQAGLTRSGFFAEAAHQRLRQEAIGIVGVGGTGTSVAAALSKAGITTSDNPDFYYLADKGSIHRGDAQVFVAKGVTPETVLKEGLPENSVFFLTNASVGAAGGMRVYGMAQATREGGVFAQQFHRFAKTGEFVVRKAKDRVSSSEGRSRSSKKG